MPTYFWITAILVVIIFLVKTVNQIREAVSMPPVDWFLLSGDIILRIIGYTLYLAAFFVAIEVIIYFFSHIHISFY